MHIPVTVAFLVVLTIAMILVGIYWPRVPPHIRTFLICASVALIILHGLFTVTKWTTVSNRLNVLIAWLAIVGYELLVLRFSRLSPRWLTVPSAIVLLILVFASSVVVHLDQIFDPALQRVPLPSHLYYEITPWRNVGAGTTGVDVAIYRRPALVPFLRHKIQAIPYNDHECNANASYAIVLPEKKSVLGRCPYWPSQSSGSYDKLLPLP
jgi:hypothetical protein